MDPSGLLELRIDSPSVPITTGRPTSLSNPSICLLSGPLEDLVRYSRQEASKWLIDLAHDICDPAQQHGSLLVWQEPQQQWSLVAPTDPLTASIYRYDLPDGTTIGLSKISQRAGRSRTTEDEHASAMGDRVKRRDGVCSVTGFKCPLVVSHILPKRMGDPTARIVFENFTSLATPANLSIYDDIFGVTLLHGNLTILFDNYEMGFHFLSPDHYECHAFAILAPGEHETVLGVITGPTIYPNIHGLRAAPPGPQSDKIPPAGLFRWHYLQCVLKKFAHDDYKSLDDIDFLELPLRMEGDSDSEGTDSKLEWPSKSLDLGRAAENDSREREARNQAVATWIEST